MCVNGARKIFLLEIFPYGNIVSALECSKGVYDWIKTFGRCWVGQLDRIRRRAERAARERTRPANLRPPQPHRDDRQKGTES